MSLNPNLLITAIFFLAFFFSCSEQQATEGQATGDKLAAKINRIGEAAIERGKVMGINEYFNGFYFPQWLRVGD